jgi:hypothetical protein
MFKQLGIKEKQPKNKELIFDKLDSKSKRIMNRIVKYIKDNNTDIDTLFKTEITQMLVKKKKEVERVSYQFFNFSNL